MFRVPARAEGVYDVHVFAPDGRQSVLTAALTYVASTDASAPGGSTPGSGGSGTGGSPGGGAGSDGSTGGGADSDVRTGPGGIRLVRSAVFAGLEAVLSSDCSVSCSGVPV